MPEFQPVVSSNVDAVGYDEKDQIVYVRFTTGAIYAYKGVPQHEFENLRTAASVGSYLNGYFKNVYPYERVG